MRGHVAARQTTPKAFGAKSVLIHAPFKRLVLVKKIFCAVVVGFNSDFRFRRQKHIRAGAKKQQRRNECQNLKGN